jgi:small-conductance mechanosensitive channel
MRDFTPILDTTRALGRQTTLLLALLLATAVPSAGSQGQTPPSDRGSEEQAAAQVADSASTARALLAHLTSLYGELIPLVDSTRVAEGETADLIRLRGLAVVDSLAVLKGRLITELRVVRRDHPSVDSIRTAFADQLRAETRIVDEAIVRRKTELDRLRRSSSVTPPEELQELEERIARETNALDSTLAFEIRGLGDAEAIGLEVAERAEAVERLLLSTATDRAGRLQLALADRELLEDRVEQARSSDTDEEEIADLDLRLRLAAARVERLAGSLDANADLMDARGLPTAAYRQLAIQATGEVTTDVLNPDVALGLTRDWLERTRTWLRDRAPNLLFQLLVILFSILVFRLAARVTWRLFRASAGRTISRLLADLLQRMVGPISTVVGTVVGLTAVGIDPTAFLAGLGVLGVIVGLALQDSLSNLAAGLFILAHRPFDVDDMVTAAGVFGVVRAMGLATTTIVTLDNRVLSVPNSKLWGDVIENRSAETRRRVDLRFRISHHEDVDRVISVVEDICDDQDQILHDPAPLVYVVSIDDSLIELEVRAWAATRHWWSVKTQLPRLVSLRFRAEGIDPPYPRQIELGGEGSSGAPAGD